jgi:hypothetical protein
MAVHQGHGSQRRYFHVDLLGGATGGCNGTLCGLCRELYPARRKPVQWRKA